MVAGWPTTCGIGWWWKHRDNITNLVHTAHVNPLAAQGLAAMSHPIPEVLLRSTQTVSSEFDAGFAQKKRAELCSPCRRHNPHEMRPV